MKKYLLTITAGLFVTAAQSQEIPDALRYAVENLNGTARYRAMSGAFGALGGDLSSINVNPAGAAIFTNNQVATTLSSYNTTNKSNYFGTNVTEHDNTFDLNQAGGILVFNNNQEKSDWRKFTMAFNYESTNNFDNSTFSAGVNPNNSIADYFLSYANGNGGVPLSLLQNSFYEQLSFSEAQAFLGYQGYLINPVEETPNNSTYVSNVPGGGNYYQENYFVSSGYSGKLTVNLATQFQDWLFFGVNANFHHSDYWQSTSFYEENNNDPTSGVQRMRFNNNLYTYGSGFSFNLGAIAKFDGLRAGLAYESPTWFCLNDALSQNLSAVRVNEGDALETVVVDPFVTILYESHQLQSPGKFTGSLAYVFGSKGLVSVDYSIKDYGNTEFGPERDFMNVNAAMSNVLAVSHEVRIGAEYRVKQLSIRGGFRNEGSPYKNKDIMGNLTGYTGGLGYNFGDTKLDLSYSYSKRESQEGFFTQGFTDGAEIKAINHNVSMTIAFEL